MLETFLSYLALYGLKDNIFVLNGAGALQIQREKMYRSFRYLNALLLILGIIVTSLISYLLHNFIYSKYNLYYISVSVNVFIVALYNLIVSMIWQKASSFKYHLYETSFSYGFDVVFTLSVIFTLDISIKIVPFLASLVAISIVVMVMNVLMGYFVRSMNRGYLNVNFRNISARLFLMALFSILVYYAGGLVA